MMQYNIENSFSKLRKMPTAKVEVKKEGNHNRSKEEEDGGSPPQGGYTGIREGFPGNGQFREIHPLHRQQGHWQVLHPVTLPHAVI